MTKNDTRVSNPLSPEILIRVDAAAEQLRPTWAAILEKVAAADALMAEVQAVWLKAESEMSDVAHRVAPDDQEAFTALGERCGEWDATLAVMWVQERTADVLGGTASLDRSARYPGQRYGWLPEEAGPLPPPRPVTEILEELGAVIGELRQFVRP